MSEQSSIAFFDITTLELAQDLVFVGGDLTTPNLLAAYTAGYFPMPVENEIGWFSPLERAVMLTDEFEPSRSLKSSKKKFDVDFNTAFETVIDACADPARSGSWIDPQIKKAYTELHQLGIAHSVEVFSEDELVGGLYGVRIGRLFAGESMFHHETDASKVAFWALCEWLEETYGPCLVDAQWITPHLRTLGFRTLSRGQYARLLATALKDTE